jgi:uncharacterized repeat protein (TIGR01451 family)
MRRNRLSLLFLIFFISAASRFWIKETTAYAFSDNAATSLCSLEDFNRIEAEFQRMVRNPLLFPPEEYQGAALNYIAAAEQCYRAAASTSQKIGETPTPIDDGGVWAPGFGPAQGEITPQFVTYGTKWGAGSPFTGGYNVVGPGLAGGTVTYSYIPNGVSHGFEGAGINTHISGLSGFNSCFYTEIETAFAAWSAVANIQFVEVSDSNTASNAAGATGDIRIGAHYFDGSGGTLAHAYYPPPNGVSIAGDLHFDSGDSWSCTTGGGFDIGIVTLHEIGHSIGLQHETVDSAVMNPFYNPSLTGLLQDDIDGAVAIYGPAMSLTASIPPNPFPIIDTTTIISYTLTVYNSSNSSVTNVAITNTIPASTTYATGSASHGGSEASAGVLTWPPATISGNSLITRTFQVTVTQPITTGNQLINSLTVTSNQGNNINAQQFVEFVNPSIIYIPLILK